MALAGLRRACGGRLPALVMFDLDGTLIDSVPDIAPALDATLLHLGLPPAGAARVRGWVGRGARELVRDALAFAAAPDRAGLLDEALRHYLDTYHAHCTAHTVPMPGARELLAGLADAGIPCACVTNKAGRIMRRVLDHLAIADCFFAALGGDSGHGVKPDPGALLHLLAQRGIAPDDAVLVGDSRHDVGAARAAGVPVICVREGYNHGEDIALAAPDAVLGSLAELL